MGRQSEWGKGGAWRIWIRILLRSISRSRRAVGRQSDGQGEGRGGSGSRSRSGSRPRYSTGVQWGENLQAPRNNEGRLSDPSCSA